jgi:hypothetical protein
MTPMQERFAREVASGKSQAAAYRIAYPKSQKWKDTTVCEAASRLMGNSKVSAIVDELKAKAAEKCILSRQEWLQRLKDVAEAGEDQPSRLKALVEFGKAEGFFAPDKLNVSGGLNVVVNYED